MNHQKNDTAEPISPFEQVRKAEDDGRARVEVAKKKYDHETLEKLQGIDANKMKQEDALRTSLNEELKSAMSTEAAGIISEAEKHAEKDVAELVTLEDKHRRKTEGDLLKQALDPSFFLAV